MAGCGGAAFLTDLQWHDLLIGFQATPAELNAIFDDPIWSGIRQKYVACKLA